MEVKITKQKHKHKETNRAWTMPQEFATNATASLPVIICATNIAENVNVSDKSFILWNNH